MIISKNKYVMAIEEAKLEGVNYVCSGESIFTTKREFDLKDKLDKLAKSYDNLDKLNDKLSAQNGSLRRARNAALNESLAIKASNAHRGRQIDAGRLRVAKDKETIQGQHQDNSQLQHLLFESRQSAARYSAATREQIKGLELELRKHKAALKVGDDLLDGYRLKVVGLRADKRVLSTERLELRQTVNSLTVQLGDAQAALRGATDMSKQHVPLKSGKISGKYFDVNSLYPNQVFNFTPPEPKAYCVMKCVKEFPGALVHKMPITSDESLEDCITTVNAKNEINQDSSVHYEIQVF